ncbi:NADPH-dependent FMN reductase RutF [Thermoclostridium stercorarium subsp. stercorarium DSM 8532]|uniref:NADPH-dependent FMN reductase RutF n=2 Tax=Thermoclostridium stercorarium TaxID=1510 RepID=L7VR14_THES1|nr:flavodoxin family protein [Thermoclostridium stercorarium]AGC68841.1 NADPH-dependent FMN reductase RutF [Thermoclostridium stercorarium subsp. stercorarium DSM 8532]AGI39839.1 FMN reductase [Thermoclostridium stercorarium subsp. stercorarium DSM 8532]ANW99146.1 NADPH-dependent FMN reductase [Thermoclostridium stercorarium subsp. thermolacticum DSM 2910]UZQ84834.1 flavodoxin family protein [Thermoclostridium stercorarium]
MKYIVAVNASPRTNWNTAKLVEAAARGAREAGADAEVIHLYKLEPFKGCISCFRCKLPESFGRCAVKDGLTEVLGKIRKADGLILGSPNYLSEMTAGFRALYERLVFQSLTYNKERPNCNEHMIPVLLIHTSNCDESYYDKIGYTVMLDRYKQTLERFVGPTKVMICGNTLQVDDYSKYDWTVFDPEEKKSRHEKVFPLKLKEAYELGASLV